MIATIKKACKWGVLFAGFWLVCVGVPIWAALTLHPLCVLAGLFTIPAGIVLMFELELD